MTDDSTKHPAEILAARVWDVLQQPNHSTTPEEIEQILRDGMAELGLARVGVDADADPYPPERRCKLQDVFDTAHVQTVRMVVSHGIEDGHICARDGCTGKMRRRVRGCSCDVCIRNRPVVCSECGAQA